MEEQWTEALSCPKCRKTGKANLSQGEHDDVPSVNDASEEFEVIKTRYGPHFRCRDCGIKAQP